MRVYEGLVDEGSDPLVLVNGEKLPSRLDLANHSPDGLNWGYSGSGPAQLALAILADHLQHRPQDKAIARRLQDRRGGSIGRRRDLPVNATDEEVLGLTADDLAVRCHQHFKGAYVAALDMSTSWRIDSDGVSEILMRMANHGLQSRFDREEPV